jgi:hypothetical protein
MTKDTFRERVVLETSKYRIEGEVTLPVEGYRSRLSDLLNREGLSFVPVVNATISGLDGEEPDYLPFIAVARDHVQLAYEGSVEDSN